MRGPDDPIVESPPDPTEIRFRVWLRSITLIALLVLVVILALADTFGIGAARDTIFLACIGALLTLLVGVAPKFLGGK